MSKETLLAVSEIDLYYGNFQALNAVSLELGEHDVLSVVGSNGAGKSSLLRTIVGLHRPSRGRIYFDGAELIGLKTCAIVRRGVSLCPEGRMVFAQLSVLDNLRLGAWVRRGERRDTLQGDLAACFRLFPKLAERKSQLAGTLSGGEQQMLAFSRALMSRPRLLMLDEPTLGLAPAVAKEILQAIGNISSLPFKCSILLIEQNAAAALAVAHRILILERGKVSWYGQANSLIESGRSAHSALARAYFGIETSSNAES